MKNILLVEDDIALRKQICFSLEKDFNIFEAKNRKETIAALKKNNIDIVLLDLGLPPSENTPKEGLKLIDHILDKDLAKIIVLTGQETEKAAVESIKRGVFDYLLKPVKIENLLFSIERAAAYQNIEKKIDAQGIKNISLNVKVGEGLQTLREAAEKKIIQKVLKDTDFNVYKTAKIMGIKRESLYYFIKKFGWKREKFD
ncbi:MAG: response regulator [Nitrospinota bacterium]